MFRQVVHENLVSYPSLDREMSLVFSAVLEPANQGGRAQARLNRTRPDVGTGHVSFVRVDSNVMDRETGAVDANMRYKLGCGSD